MAYTLSSTRSLVGSPRETEDTSFRRRIHSLKKRDAETQEVVEIIGKNILSHLIGTIGLVDSGDPTSIADDFSFKNTVFKILKTVGKSVITMFVRPIVRFTYNVLAKFARVIATGLVRYVITPVIGAIAGFLLANPITAAFGTAFLAAGGAYLLYDKLGRRTSKELNLKTPESISFEELGYPLIQAAPSAPPEVTSAVRYEPVTTARTLTGKKGVSKKFAGFGADVDSYINETSAKFSIPADVFRGLVHMEKGWTGEMSPTGAIGTGQFTAGTWNSLIKNHGGASLGMIPLTGIYKEEPARIKPNPYGGNYRTPQDPRFDKRANTLATGLLASLNAKTLVANGIPVTAENLYMLHNIGDGIIPVMKGRGASAATLDAMRKNGMLSGQTAQDFLNYQKARYQRSYEIANSTAVVDSNMTDSGGVVIDKHAIAAGVAQPQSAGSGSASGGSTTTDKNIVKAKNKLIEVK